MRDAADETRHRVHQPEDIGLLNDPHSSVDAGQDDIELISPDAGDIDEAMDDEEAALAFCEEEGLVWTEHSGWVYPEDAEEEGDTA